MTVFRFRGKWRYSFFKDGRRIQGYGFRTKELARMAETDARRNLTKTNSDFIKLCEERLRDLRLRRSSEHFNQNRLLLEKLVPRWAKLKEITREHVESLLNELALTSPIKANKALRSIRALFNYGIERGMVSRNPTKHVRMFPVDQRPRYVPPAEDLMKVLATASEEQRNYLLVVLHTMGRITAVNRLKWEDVHEEYLILRTRKARNSNVKEIRIPINRVLKEVLTKLPRHGEYVFTSPVSKQHFAYRNELMRRLCARAGVKRFSYHALRHFGASHLVKAGVPLTDVQALLGHERATTTAIYLRALGDGVKDAVKKLEEL